MSVWSFIISIFFIVFILSFQDEKMLKNLLFVITYISSISFESAEFALTPNNLGIILSLRLF